MTRKDNTVASFPVLDDAALVLKLDDLDTETVQVPEWGLAVVVRALTGTERDAYEASLLTETKDSQGNVSREVNMRNMRAKLVAASCRKPDGTPVFTSKQAVDLGMKNAHALDRIFRAAQRLSGLSDEEVSELVEDFGQGPSAASGSA